MLQNILFTDSERYSRGVMRNRFQTLMVTICIFSLSACATREPFTNNDVLALALYRPVDFSGGQRFYIDKSRTLTGISNEPYPHEACTFTPDKQTCSIAMAVRDAIKTEGVECLGLANVRVHTNRGLKWMLPCKVTGNPVYKKN